MFNLEVEHAKEVARRLLGAYNARNIFGPVTMPEEENRPRGVDGVEEHARFITLTVAIDYMRDAEQLWAAARRTYEDPATRYLFVPPEVANAGLMRIIGDMQRYGLSRKFRQDAATWQQVCTGLAIHFDGRVEALLERAGYDAVRLLATIRSSRLRSDFPFLKGPKIGPLWVRMLYDNCGVALRRIADVALPVDVHTAQATMQTGCVAPREPQGDMRSLRDAVQQVWRQALRESPEGAYPLQMDRPLWLLSRRACRRSRDWPCGWQRRCPAAELCAGRRLWLSVAGNPNADRAEWSLEGW